MGTHRFPRPYRVALLDRRQNPFVMELSALRPTVDIKNPAALLPKKTHNRIQQ